MRRKQYSKSCHAWQWLATVVLCLLATSLWSMGWAAPGDTGVRNNQVGIGQADRAPAGDRVRIGDGETIAREKYLMDCGQACAFQNASEVMTAAQLYFMSGMRSAETVANDDARQNVQDCLEGKRCNKKKLLNSSLHYNFGRQLRANVLENNTNFANLQSLDKVAGEEIGDHDIDYQQYQWMRNSDDWAAAFAEGPEGLPEFNSARDRENFKFDLDEIATTEERINKELEELDPQFTTEYKAFLTNYSGPTYQDNPDKIYAEYEGADLRGDRSRALAANEVDTEVFAGNTASPRVNAALRDRIRRAHEKLETPLQEATEAAVEISDDETTGKPTFANAPGFINERDTGFLQRRIDNFKRAEAEIASMIRTGIATSDKPVPEDELQRLENSLPGLERDRMRTYGAVKSYFAELRRNMQQDLDQNGDRSAERIATSLNERITRFQQENFTIGENGEEVVITYSIAGEQFEAFLDKIWPSDNLPPPPRSPN